MKKKILLIGLWWQWQKFLKYFLSKSNEYEVIWCCKTDITKKKIVSTYWIDVSTDYKKIGRDKFDLVVSTVYPTNVQYQIVEYILENTNNKVLIDLPITFNLNKLKYLLSFDNLYLFNFEHYTKIFKLTSQLKDRIKKINATLFVWEKNILSQIDTKKALVVDMFYMLNNLIEIDLGKIVVNYTKKIVVKDVEFLLEIVLISGEKIIYKYEDGKGIIMFNWKLIIDNLTYENVLNLILNNIFSDNFNKINYHCKIQHLKYWGYLIHNYLG